MAYPYDIYNLNRRNVGQLDLTQQQLELIRQQQSMSPFAAYTRATLPAQSRYTFEGIAPSAVPGIQSGDLRSAPSGSQYINQTLSDQYLRSATGNAPLEPMQEAPLQTFDEAYPDLSQQSGAAPRRTLGLLGDMFGGASALDEYMTPEQRAQLQNQGVMAAAMQLLASSGPSRTPVGLGQALGEAYGAGQKGYTAAQQNLLTSMAAKQKMDEAKATKDMQATVSTFLAQKAPEGVDAKEFKAQQYMRLADVYAATNPDQANKFFDMAQKLMPVRAKVSGPPIEVTGPDGKPILIQQNEYGDYTTLQGFGPKRKVVLQNIDGVMTAINESELQGGEKFGTGISAVEQTRIDNEKKRIEMEGTRLGYDRERIDLDKKRFEEVEKAKLGMEREQLGMARQRLNLSLQEFQRGSYDRVQNEDGVFYVPKVPGLPTIQVTGPDGAPLKGSGAGGKPTESEQNAAGFALRMERTDAIINALPPGVSPGMGSAVAGNIPMIGGAVQRGIQSANTQKYQQAANDWIRAKLRKESGAKIDQDEMDKEYETYFPRVNDTPAVIAQKAEARRIATEAMKLNAGKSYRSVESLPPPATGGTDVRSQADRILSGGR